MGFLSRRMFAVPTAANTAATLSATLQYVLYLCWKYLLKAVYQLQENVIINDTSPKNVTV